MDRSSRRNLWMSSSTQGNVSGPGRAGGDGTRRLARPGTWPSPRLGTSTARRRPGFRRASPSAWSRRRVDGRWRPPRSGPVRPSTDVAVATTGRTEPEWTRQVDGPGPRIPVARVGPSLRLVFGGQTIATACSTGRGLPPALRPRPRRLRDPAAHPSRLLCLVPQPDFYSPALSGRVVEIDDGRGTCRYRFQVDECAGRARAGGRARP